MQHCPHELWLVAPVSCPLPATTNHAWHQWSSGYDVSLTRWRSPVRSWPGVYFGFDHGGRAMRLATCTPLDNLCILRRCCRAPLCCNMREGHSTGFAMPKRSKDALAEQSKAPFQKGVGSNPTGVTFAPRHGGGMRSKGALQKGWVLPASQVASLAQLVRA